MRKYKIHFTKYAENTLGIVNRYVLENMSKTHECEIVEADNDVSAIDKLETKYGKGRIGHILRVIAI